MRLDHVRKQINRVIPNVFKNHGSGHELAFVLHKVMQEGEFLGRKVNMLTAAGRASGGGIENEIRNLEGLGL